MQNYYRNVGLWLATPEQRAAMLIAATWGAGRQAPSAFSHALSIWEIGERVVDVIGRTAPQCIVSELVEGIRPIGTGTGAQDPRHRRGRGPPATAEAAMVNQAIAGRQDLYASRRWSLSSVISGRLASQVR